MGTDARENWWHHPDVRSAFETWRRAQADVAALCGEPVPTDLRNLDARLRAAQSQAMQAWHMYEMERENAGGPLAGHI